MLVAAAFLSTLPVEAQTFRQTKQGITGTTQGMDIEIQFVSPEIVRVVKAPEGRSFTKKSLSVVKSPESMSVTTEKKGETVSLKSNAVRVDFNVETGRISFFDKQGKALFTEKDYGAQFTPFNDAGNQTFSVRQAFLLDKDEAIYGLGQQQVDDLNQRNHKHFMHCMPVFQSFSRRRGMECSGIIILRPLIQIIRRRCPLIRKWENVWTIISCMAVTPMV